MDDRDRQQHDRDEMDEALEQRLEAYADARLQPDPARIARMRVELMIAAREGLKAGSPAAEPVALAARRPTSRGRRWIPALLAAAIATAVLAGAAAAGSGPGGPLYGARLWVEDVTLPSSPDARFDAQLRHLQERLDEAAGAASRGNGPAVQAALDAYRATVDAALASAGDELDREQHLALVLGRHLAVLEALTVGAPAGASDAIQRAIDRTETKIDQVQNATPKPNPGGGPGAKPTPGGPDKTPPGGGPGAKPTPGGPDKTPPGGGPGVKPTPGGPDKTPPGKPSKSPKP